MNEETLTPAFVTLECGQDYTGVLCPKCGGHETHVRRVDVWNRMEDSKSGEHVFMEMHDDVSGASSHGIDRDMAGNTSRRRGSVSILFSCERCADTFAWRVAQHKGQTFIYE